MLFDDLFYPDNRKRRDEVYQLKAEVTTAFRDYHSAWNTWAGLLNHAFAECSVEAYHSLHIPVLVADVEKNTLQECLDEIHVAVTQTSETMDRIVEAMGIRPFLPPDWKTNGIKLDSIDGDVLLKIGRAISCVGSVVLAGYVGYYTICGVAALSTLIAAVEQTAISVGALVGGVIGGVVLGGVAFVITDLIASAITGAIERKELNEAIDILKKLKADVAQPLRESAFTIHAVCTDIKHKQFPLGDGYVLVGQADGTYVIMRLQPLSTAHSACVQGQQKRHENMEFIPVAVAGTGVS